MEVIPSKCQFLNLHSQFKPNQYFLPARVLPLKKKYSLSNQKPLTSFSIDFICSNDSENVDNRNLQTNSFINNHTENSNLNQNENLDAHEIPPKSSKTTKSERKEKNRIAAKKWRKNQDKYMNDLINENDELRKQALFLINHMKELRIENIFYDNELKFFQSFILNKIHVP